MEQTGRHTVLSQRAEMQNWGALCAAVINRESLFLYHRHGRCASGCRALGVKAFQLGARVGSVGFPCLGGINGGTKH